MGLVRAYSEDEVSRILKQSEGVGHAESRHEIVAVGEGRASTSVQAMEDRALGERKAVVGAFDGSQIKAVTFALNSQAGRSTLIYLSNPRVLHVFAKIDVSSQTFKMKMATIDNVPKIGPLMKPQVVETTACFVFMKLMAKGETLHIQTAYPVWDQRPLPPSTCEIAYVGGFSMNQELPV